jgi:hypothetical protein
MSEHEALLRKSYAAYNARDLPTLLTALAPDVEWEDQFEGVVIHGVEAVGAYWRRQWKELDPIVEFKHFEMDPMGRGVSTLILALRGPDGAILSKGLLRHVYQFENGLVKNMRMLL